MRLKDKKKILSNMLSDIYIWGECLEDSLCMDDILDDMEVSLDTDFIEKLSELIDFDIQLKVNISLKDNKKESIY